MSVTLDSSVALASPLTSVSNRIMESLVFPLWAGWPRRRKDLLSQREVHTDGFAGAA